MCAGGGEGGALLPEQGAATDLWEEEGVCDQQTLERSLKTPDLDKSSHLVDTLSSEVSSNVVTLETKRRRRQKKAASALCGISCRRTREGGRAGRVGVGGMVNTHDHPIDSNKPQFLALGTPPS